MEGQQRRAAEGDTRGAIQGLTGPKAACWTTKSIPSLQQCALHMEKVDAEGHTQLMKLSAFP